LFFAGGEKRYTSKDVKLNEFWAGRVKDREGQFQQ
jgi:hypothetical protein